MAKAKGKWAVKSGKDKGTGAKRGAEQDVSGGVRTAVARQLVAANQDLKSVYETEHQWRLDLLKANEDLSRETVSMETEIRKLQQENLQLKATLAELTKQRDALAIEVANLSRQRDVLKEQTDKSSAERDHLDSAVKELTRERESLSKHVGELGKELAKLKADVERLEALRKEYLSQIARFRSEKAKLVE